MKFHCRNKHDWESERFEAEPWEKHCPDCGSPALSGLSQKINGPGLRRDAESDVLAEAHARFSQLVKEWPCWFSWKIEGERRRPDHHCWGPRDPHHLIPASFIREHYGELPDIDLADILYDPIIGVPLCRKGHQEVEARTAYIYFDELDDELIEFCIRKDGQYPDCQSLLERLMFESPAREAVS